MNRRQKIESAALAASVIIAGSSAALLGAFARTRGEKQGVLRSTIAFVSTRHDPAADPQRGAWAGMLKVGSGESRLVLHVRKDHQGAQRDDFRQAKADAIATETVFLTRTVTVGKNTYDYLVHLPEGSTRRKRTRSCSSFTVCD